MFSDVVNIIVDWIGIIESLKPSVWHVFLVLSPGNSPLFKDIDNGCDLGRDTVKSIVPNAEIVSADDGYVIRFRRMSYGIIIREKDPLGCEEL